MARLHTALQAPISSAGYFVTGMAEGVTGSLERGIANRRLDLQERALGAEEAKLESARRAALMQVGGGLDPLAPDPGAADPDPDPSAFIPGVGSLPGIGLGTPTGILANYTGPSGLVPASMLQQDPAPKASATDSALSTMREVNPTLADRFARDFAAIQHHSQRAGQMGMAELRQLGELQKDFEERLGGWFAGPEYTNYTDNIKRSEIERWQTMLPGPPTSNLTKIKGDELQALYYSQKERFANKQYINLQYEHTKNMGLAQLETALGEDYGKAGLGALLGDDKHLYTDLMEGPGPDVNTPEEANAWSRGIADRVAYATMSSEQKALMASAVKAERLALQTQRNVQAELRKNEVRKELAKGYGDDLDKALADNPSQWELGRSDAHRAELKTRLDILSGAVAMTATPEGRERLGVDEDYTTIADIDEAIRKLTKATTPQKLRELAAAQEEAREKRRRRDKEKRGSDTATTLRAGK